MKKLFFLMVFVSGLLLIGCQENSITNPVQPSVDKSSSTKTSVEGILTLQGPLYSPYSAFDSYYVIKGDVDYQLSYQYLDNSNPYLQQVTILKLQIKAQLIDYNEASMAPFNEKIVGVISGETTDAVNIDTDAPYTITKKFTVQKSDYALSLAIKFDVKAKSVKINSMWLESISLDSEVNNSSY